MDTLSPQHLRKGGLLPSFVKQAAGWRGMQYGLLAFLFLFALGNFPGGVGTNFLQALSPEYKPDVKCTELSTTPPKTSGSYPLNADLSKDLQGCRVKVLDISKELAAKAGIPSCDPNDVTVWPYSQWGWRTDGYNRPVEHFHRQHAAAYYITKAIAASRYAVEDIEDADVVIVDDYCYWTWWQSQSRQGGVEDWANEHLDFVETGPFLQRAVREVMKLNKYNETGGRSFVYILADPNSSRSDIFGPFVCDKWPGTIFPAVIERGQMCGGGDRSGRNDLIIPYSSTKRVPGVNYERARETFLFFLAGCHDSDDRSVGMRLRFAAIQAFSQFKAADVSVKCQCSSCPGHLEHTDVFAKMGRSKFCLVLPGDTQASRRLTEVILMGCIPVFIGPPFHSLPLSDYVDYSSLGYFFYIKHASWIVDHIDAFNLDLWRLDTNASVIEVDFLEGVYTYLRGVRDCEVKRRQKALQDHRRFFFYALSLKEERPQAVDVVLHSLCSKIRKRAVQAGESAADSPSETL